jgi:hypothetical protein
MALHAGYRGIAQIGGEYVRFSDASISAKQAIEAPDLIMGNWDRMAYVYGKIEVGGSMSGPITESFAENNGVLEWAATRGGNCGTLSEKTVNLWYYCPVSGNNYRQFTGLYVNSLEISVTAGEVAQFSLDVMGKNAGAWSNNAVPLRENVEKLMTWDKFNLNIDGPGGPISDIDFSAFSISIANNLSAQYSLGQSDLFPFEIVPGLRHISGSITVYNVRGDLDGANNWDAYTAGTRGSVTFSLGSITATANVQFHRAEPSSQVGVITSTVGFTGVGDQPTGSIW